MSSYKENIGDIGSIENQYSTKTFISLDHERSIEQFSIFINLFAGACAGVVAKTIISPLDRANIIFQVSDVQFTYRRACNVLYKGYKKNGILSWWRGNTATIVRMVPYTGIQFATHEHLKRVFGASTKGALPPGKRFAAGAGAGAMASFVTYPLDLVRTRMVVASVKKYTTLRHVFISVYREEGLRTFYNGFIPTFLGIMPYAGTSFFVYESLKRQYHLKYPDEELSVIYRLVFGGISGVCGQTLSYPLDIVRRRMQTDGIINGKSFQHKKFIFILKDIFYNEGMIKGFFKGMSVNWIKSPVAVGISFATFDTMKYFLENL